MADPSVPHSDKEVGVEKEIQPERNSPQGEREITSSDSKPEENRAAQDESSSGSPSVTEEQPPKTPPPIEEKSRAKTRITLIMLALGMAVFLAALDMTIITTALPTIAANFRASEADYTWIGSSYLLGAAASMPTWGKISDIFGRKPIILVANIVFLVGSLICALSININMLLGGRVVQGIGGGGLLSLVNICISDLFSLRTRGIYFSIIGGVWALASAVGPILGGVFTQLATWRWCFYINLPCDGLALVLLFFFLDIETPKTPLLAGLYAIDWLGSLAVVGGTCMFLLGLEFGGISYPWSSAIVLCLIIFGLLTLTIFILIEHYQAKYPLMPLRLFNTRSNACAFLTAFVHGWVFISGSYFLPLYFQTVLSATPLQSGYYLFPFVVSLSVASAITGVYIRKTGQYLPPIWFGMFFMLLGFALMTALPATTDWAKIIMFQIIAGVGVGPNFQSPLLAIQSALQPRDIASATATFGFVRNLANAVSVVIGGVIFQNRMRAQTSSLSSSGLSPSLLSTLSNGGSGAAADAISSLPELQKMALKEAYTASLKDMWIFYAVIAAVGFLGSFGIKRNELHKAHEVTKTGLDVQKEGRRMDVEERRRKREGKGVKMKDVEAAVGENVWEKGMDDTGEMVGSGEKKGSKEVEG